MKSFSLLSLLVASAAVVSANADFDSSIQFAHHRRLARRQPEPVPISSPQGGLNLSRKRDASSNGKRCRPQVAMNPSQNAAPVPAAQPSDNNSNNNSSPPSNSGGSSNNNSGGNNSSPPVNNAATGGSGSSNLPSSACGPSNASPTTTQTGGPNGDINYLNCGVEGGGWNPPFITVNQIVTVDLNSPQASSTFAPCAPYFNLFNQYGAQFNIPPIMLASFAMQESGCNPNAVGGAGELGLMQLTHDKCGAGDCRDPNYNVMTGAAYFSSQLSANGGNLLKTIGGYNGWPIGMTVGSATAAAGQGCCRCQNNLDYLDQFLNGWCQGINAYTANLGKYFNLAACPL